MRLCTCLELEARPGKYEQLLDHSCVVEFNFPRDTRGFASSSRKAQCIQEEGARGETRKTRAQREDCRESMCNQEITRNRVKGTVSIYEFCVALFQADMGDDRTYIRWPTGTVPQDYAAPLKRLHEESVETLFETQQRPQ